MSTRYTPSSRRSGRKRKIVSSNGEPLSKEEEARREKLLAKVFDQLRLDCGKILEKLMAMDIAEMFLEPVDPVKHGVPTYYDLIKNPMDFSTVKSKLQQKLFGSLDEFIDDVRLIYTNCFKFNAVGSEICFMAAALSKIFEAEMENVRDKEDELIEEAELLELKQTLSQLLEEQTKMFQELEKLRNEPNLNQSFSPPIAPVVPKKGSKAAAASKKTKKKKSGERSTTTRKAPNFTKKRKQDLTRKINSLEQTQLEKVAEILNLGKTEGEVEIDLDKLPNQTLHRLESFVNQTLNLSYKGSMKGNMDHLDEPESSVSPKNDDSFSSSSDDSDVDVEM